MDNEEVEQFLVGLGEPKYRAQQVRKECVCLAVWCPPLRRALRVISFDIGVEPSCMYEHVQRYPSLLSSSAN